MTLSWPPLPWSSSSLILLGTGVHTVTLHLKSEYLGMTNAESVQRSVRKYTDFLPFPIYVNNQGPTNTMQASWASAFIAETQSEGVRHNWIDASTEW